MRGWEVVAWWAYALVGLPTLFAASYLSVAVVLLMLYPPTPWEEKPERRITYLHMEKARIERERERLIRSMLTRDR